MQRFFIKFKNDSSRMTIYDPNLIHQISKVMRAKIGTEIILVNEGWEAYSEITAITKDKVEIKISEVGKNRVESDQEINLFCALLKRENFELIVQKVTEIGITKIVPIITLHTVKTGLKYERLERIAREAAELCGRSAIPTIVETMDFKTALQDSVDTDKQIQSLSADAAGAQSQEGA